MSATELRVAQPLIEVRASPLHGLGVFALRPIAVGTRVIAYLGEFTAKDFEGAGARVISQPRWEGKVMTGAELAAAKINTPVRLSVRSGPCAQNCRTAAA